MNAQRHEKARSRLKRAEQALESLKAAKSFDDFDTAWTDFLLALNSVYAILEQASKQSPQSRQWFGARKKERRKDPLLAYFHQARNTDEHGIERITERHPQSIGIGAPGSEVRIEHAFFDGKKVEIRFDPSSPDKTVKIHPAKVRMLPVINSIYGDRFELPTEHMGKPIEDLSLMGLAAVALKAHRAVLDDAEKLIS
jgi:hypothetical protein